MTNLKWTKLYIAIQRANQIYPYKLWMRYNTDDKQPCYYIINNDIEEFFIGANFSRTLQYAEERYENRS